jgi:hypothetical protein
LLLRRGGNRIASTDYSVGHRKWIIPNRIITVARTICGLSGHSIRCLKTLRVQHSILRRFVPSLRGGLLLDLSIKRIQRGGGLCLRAAGRRPMPRQELERSRD